MISIAVASGSFSRNATLCTELLKNRIKTKFWRKDRVLKGQELVDFLSGASHAIVGKEPIDEPTLKALPHLEVISKYGVGLDNLDLTAISKAGVICGWTPGVNKRAVAELTLQLILSLVRRSQVASFNLKNGLWKRELGQQLTGSTVGIIGCGNIGKDVSRLLRPFGCRILANDLVIDHDFYKKHDIKPCSLENLLTQAQIVTLHLPLNQSTAHIIDRRALSLMRKGSFLINTARGGLVCEDSLYEALIRGHLEGAACDVFWDEPQANPKLLELDQFIGTPHIGGSSKEAVLAMGRAAIKGLELKDSTPCDHQIEPSILHQKAFPISKSAAKQTINVE